MKKTILILGGYGFLGANILHHIDSYCMEQYSVIVFDKFQKHLAGLKFDCVKKVYTGDFSNSNLIERIFLENNIDLVIHAISTTVPVDSCSARFDVETNLLPTLELLGIMTKYKVKDIVYLSSGGAVYGTNGKLKHKESDEVFPISSYGVIKLTIEKYLMQYAQLYGLLPLIVRISNPYGPFHYSMKQGVINIAMTAAVKGEPFKIWGDGNGKKDYIFVEDFVRILFLLIHKNVSCSVINIGSGMTLSVNDIVEHVKEFVPTYKWEYIEASKFDASHFELDTTKLEDIIGKYNYTDIQTGFQLTYNWTKENIK